MKAFKFSFLEVTALCCHSYHLFWLIQQKSNHLLRPAQIGLVLPSDCVIHEDYIAMLIKVDLIHCHPCVYTKKTLSAHWIWLLPYEKCKNQSFLCALPICRSSTQPLNFFLKFIIIIVVVTIIARIVVSFSTL